MYKRMIDKNEYNVRMAAEARKQLALMKTDAECTKEVMEWRANPSTQSFLIANT